MGLGHYINALDGYLIRNENDAFKHVERRAYKDEGIEKLFSKSSAEEKTRMRSRLEELTGEEYNSGPNKYFNGRPNLLRYGGAAYAGLSLLQIGGAIAAASGPGLVAGVTGYLIGAGVQAIGDLYDDIRASRAVKEHKSLEYVEKDTSKRSGVWKSIKGQLLGTVYKASPILSAGLLAAPLAYAGMAGGWVTSLIKGRTYSDNKVLSGLSDNVIDKFKKEYGLEARIEEEKEPIQLPTGLERDARLKNINRMYSTNDLYDARQGNPVVQYVNPRRKAA